MPRELTYGPRLPTLAEDLDALGYHHGMEWKRGRPVLVVFDHAHGAPVAKLWNEAHVRAWIADGCPWPAGAFPADRGTDRWWCA